MRYQIRATRNKIRDTILIGLVPVMLLALCTGCVSTGGGAASAGQAGLATSGINAGGRKIIKSIEFVNNRSFKDVTLKKKLDFAVGDYLDPILTETYRRTIAEFYRKKGYAFVAVSLDREELEAGRVIYTIAEGPRVKIGSVTFKGNDSIKTSSLKGAIKTKSKKLFLWPRYYVEEKPAEDVARLQTIYYNKGFLNYKIDVIREFTEDRKEVNITFEIDEGPSYTVQDILLKGNEYFDDQKLLEGLKLEPGDVYNKRMADSHAADILKLYNENGFMDAFVAQREEFVPDSNNINVLFSITEGRQFRIGRIDITGNEQTQDKVIRRVLDEYGFLPGELYNADLAPAQGQGKLEEYVQRMTLAEEVIVKPVAPTSQVLDQKDLRVDIQEGQTGSIMLNGGVSSDSDVIGQLIYEERNFDISDWPENLGELVTGEAFKGGGQSLRVSLEPGTQISQYTVSFTEPYFQDEPLSLTIKGTSWKREIERRGRHTLYDESRDKGYVGLSKRYEDKWRRSISFRAENINVDDIYLFAPKEIKEINGYTFLVGVRAGVGRDMRDDRFNPGAGYVFDMGYEQVAGDDTFGIVEGNWVGYKTLYEDLLERKTVMALKLLAATTIKDAPPFEKFYAGGTGTYGIRGFEYRGVSTRGIETNVVNPQKRDPIGSDWIFLANTEVTVPLVSNNFSGLFFVDSGAIDTGGYRASVGAGIQITIPYIFGPVPMRFEFAAPFMKDDDDETRVFSFSVGGLF